MTRCRPVQFPVQIERNSQQLADQEPLQTKGIRLSETPLPWLGDGPVWQHSVQVVDERQRKLVHCRDVAARRILGVDQPSC
ncbi:MAG: hypothetical protein JWR63_998 [Conexibacter sp.]|nr:hypothetical protein [Conexibacter sp.]